MVKKKAQLAGYADANGDLGKPVPSGLIIVPGQVWREGDAIHWKLEGHAKLREPSPAMLTEFVALHQADSTDAILRFAQQWGVLVLKQHGKLFCPCGESMPEGIEPIEAWRYYSHRAAAVMRIAVALRDGKLGDLADWGVIAALQSGDEKADRESIKTAMDRDRYGMGFFHDIPRGTPRRSAMDQGRDVIAREVGDWLTFWKANRMRGLSDFSLRWSPDARKWGLEIEYHGFLFAAIALQLALFVADADSLYICSACSQPYIRTKKRPKTGWANYCDRCIERGVGGRRAVQAYQRKRREAKRLATEGLLLAEIAAKVNSDPETVQGWLKQAKKGKRNVKEGAEARQAGKQRRFDLPNR